MHNLIETDKKYVANTYNRFPVEIVSGKGSRVYDKNGKEYIQCNDYYELIIEFK